MGNLSRKILESFGSPPELRVSPREGLLLFGCWGERVAGVKSGEWGTYFSTEKPVSVLDAELRFNIVNWPKGSGLHFVSSFSLKSGFAYWIGPVAHGKTDKSRPCMQVFIEEPLTVKLELVKSKELLRHDVYVGPQDGHA